MLYIHCYGHALNVAVKDSCCNVPILKESFKMTKEITKLVKYVPQRNMKLNELRQKRKNESKSLHAFCSTQWTIRGETLDSIIKNIQDLLDLWSWAVDNVKDTVIKT